MKDMYGYYFRRGVLCSSEEEMNAMFEKIREIFSLRDDHMRYTLIKKVVYELNDCVVYTIEIYVPKVVYEDNKNTFGMKVNKKGLVV